jgi:hypothetical protein
MAAELPGHDAATASESAASKLPEFGEENCGRCSRMTLESGPEAETGIGPDGGRRLLIGAGENRWRETTVLLLA